MSAKLSDEASRIELHPAKLLLCLATIGAPFNECWPDMSDAWRDTIRELLSHESPKGVEVDTPEPRVASAEVQVSIKSGRILEKLWRKDFWGNNYVPPVNVIKMAVLSEAEFKEAVRELQAMELIIIHKESGRAISLNTHKKAEIDEIVRHFLEEGL